MKDEKEWDKLVIGGAKGLDDFKKDLKEFNELRGRRALIKFLEEQTKAFLMITAEYFDCKLKSSRKKRAFVIGIANVISNNNKESG